MKAILLLLLLIPFTALSQPGPQMPARVYKHYTLPDKDLVKGIGFLPGRMNRMHGLSFSVMTTHKHEKPLEIHGMNIDFQPMGVFFVPYILIFQPCNVIRKQGHDSTGITASKTSGPHFASEDTMVKIKGFDLRLMGSYPSAELHGLGLTAGVSTYPLQKGAAISVFGNLSNELHGLQLALWANITETGSGVQIGLFNYADDCNCLQLGLLNRNGNTLRPFISRKRRQHT